MGLECTIEGWATRDMRQVLLKVSLNIHGNCMEFTHAVSTRNLKLTFDHLQPKAGEAAAVPDISIK